MEILLIKLTLIKKFISFVNENSNYLKRTPAISYPTFEHILSGHEWCPTNLKYSCSLTHRRPERKMAMAISGVLSLDKKGESRHSAAHEGFILQ